MTRLFRLTLVLAVLKVTAALRAGTPVEDGIRDGVLHTGNVAEPRSLDPQMNTGFYEIMITESLFEGLVVRDPATGKFLPGVAERWEASEDQRTWTFHLRPEAKWSDGVPLTADDFVWSFKRLLSPKLGAEFRYMLWFIEGAESYSRQDEPDLPEAKRIRDFAQVGVRAKDAHTLELRLANPVPYFLSIVAHDSWMPVPRHIIEKVGGMEARSTGWERVGSHVGNGAFKLKEWETNKVIRVARNEHYWDAANVKLSAICFYPIEDVATEERAYLGGLLHRTARVNPASQERFAKERPTELVIEPWLETSFLRLNIRELPLDNVLVRRALSAAVDRETIVENITRGNETPAYNLCPAGTGGYEPRSLLQHDPVQARAWLAEAGYPGGKRFPVLKLTSNGGVQNTRVVEALQEMWRKELGIDVRITLMEAKAWLSAMSRSDYQLFRGNWVWDYDDPNAFLGLMITDGGNNTTRWSNKDYDHLLDDAARTADAKKRHEKLQSAEDILLREQPLIPLYFGTSITLRHPSVDGYRMATTGQVLYKHVRLR